jgi:predicted dehydrogenase
VDYLKKGGIAIKSDPNINIVNLINEKKAAGDFDFSTMNWAELLQIEQLEIDDKEPVRLEQEAFLRAVTDRQYMPEVSAEEGLAALQCAEKILASIEENKWDEKIGV